MTAEAVNEVEAVQITTISRCQAQAHRYPTCGHSGKNGDRLTQGMNLGSLLIRLVRRMLCLHALLVAL